MKKQRIVFIITCLRGGGAEMMLYHLLRYLDRDRWEPMVISLMGRDRLGDAIEQLGVPLHTIGLAASSATPGALIKVARLVRAAQPDIIQGWMYHGNLAATLVSFLVRAPLFWCIQNSFHSFAAEKPVTRVTIRLSAMLSRRTSKIVFVSHASQLQHEALGFEKSRCMVIPNGVDPDLFQPSAAARRELREELKIPASAVLIGLIGRFHPQKDHATFLRAAAILARARPEVYFVLAGADVVPTNPAFTAALQAPELAGRLHLLGERGDMPRVNAALDIGTSSSSYGEALSLAVAEAMGCAVPCVVTDVGDSGALVDKTGVVVPPSNPEALAAGWEQLVAAGPNGRRELGLAARKRAEDCYSIPSLVRRYEALYTATAPELARETPVTL